MTGLKSTGVAVGKVVLVAIGVPYGVAILINSLHGWPQSDPDQSRFCKQLRPSRVLSLNYALWDQCSMLKWVPLFIQAKWLHDNADPSLKVRIRLVLQAKCNILLKKTKGGVL